MIKKILFISFLFFITTAFSQKTLQKLSAAPNPFTTVSKIQFDSSKKQDVYLTVKNMLGKSVYRKKHEVIVGENSIPFYRNDLQPGMYIYIIQNSKELISKRFVIK